ncbi:MAG: glutamine--fructose-6-phosphate transaminase (isomerizing) [Opitutales bacterium TMED158]|nr:MAG: glutamine--fructose-6-phosphate transaminase (isomerizing) [Opitutales bacterium TMED158]
MCGIVGYIGNREASPILLEGLKRLEYRGYDSAGVAVLKEGALKLKKHKGRVTDLARNVPGKGLSGSLGISHTRWATHGAVTEENAHPHVSHDGKISLVHNGVIENYLSVKAFLESKGVAFYSETDSEVFCNLIAYHYEKEPEDSPTRFLDSVRRSLSHIDGTYGIAAICTDCPNELVGARKGSPLIVGIGKDEYLLASDVSAIISRTSNVVYLNDGEIVSLKDGELNLLTSEEEVLTPEIKQIDWEIAESELGDYEHFMLKEIFEQPRALENAMRGRFSDDQSTAKFGGLNVSAQELRQVDRILLCACGTAWHACLVGEYLIERFARIPVEVEYASEFRYRNAPLDKNTLVLVISQSGETIDTLAALRESKRKGYKTLAINNSVGSTIARESDGGIYQHAGPEIGVASTKAFTSQLQILSMLALYLGRLRDMSYQDGIDYVKGLKQCPDLVSETVNSSDEILEISKKYKDMQDCLFLGRQDMFPIALEGALKLKEISYIHAEGYPAAEMKHGPIALINEACPAIVLATQPDIHGKLLSNIQEVKARGAPVIVIANRSNPLPEELVDDQILIPDCHRAILPILASIPMQLLSYHIAHLRGCDVDKPRNLAKSVTVE